MVASLAGGVGELRLRSVRLDSPLVSLGPDRHPVRLLAFDDRLVVGAVRVRLNDHIPCRCSGVLLFTPVEMATAGRQRARVVQASEDRRGAGAVQVGLDDLAAGARRAGPVQVAAADRHPGRPRPAAFGDRLGVGAVQVRLDDRDGVVGGSSRGGCR